jgi:hypothetical protein
MSDMSGISLVDGYSPQVGHEVDAPQVPGRPIAGGSTARQRRIQLRSSSDMCWRSALGEVRAEPETQDWLIDAS